MNIQELISEVRRNPDKNTRKHPIEVVADMYENTTDTIGGTVNLFITRTQIQKVGINPQSTYGTPNGIYLWPASDFLSHFRNYDNMHWSGDHINVLKLQGNVIDISSLSEAEYEFYYAKLVELVCDALDDDPDEVRDYLEETFSENDHVGDVDTSLPGYKLYTMALFASWNIYDDKVQSPLAWANTFRKIGIDGIVDNGEGIICFEPDEQSQGVIFSRAAILKGSEIALNAPPDDIYDVPDEYKHLATHTRAANRAKTVKRHPDVRIQSTTPANRAKKLRVIVDNLDPGDLIICTGFSKPNLPEYIGYDVATEMFVAKHPTTGEEIRISVDDIHGYMK